MKMIHNSLKKLFCAAILVSIGACERKAEQVQDLSSSKSRVRERSERVRENPTQLQRTSAEVRELKQKFEADLESASVAGTPEERERAMADLAWKSVETLPDLAE